jgi:2-aminoethylphosphonate-pyruvate transaminase
MPVADTAATAQAWATKRAIDLWVVFAGDIPGSVLAVLSPELDRVRLDGATIALVTTDAAEATSLERRLADLIIHGPEAPAPYGLLVALAGADVSDVRRMGVIGASVESLEAGHRGGAGAVVGLVRAESVGGPDRGRLLAGQPDRIVGAAEFASVDAFFYGSGRANRERVLLNPGPAVVSDRIHRAVAGPDLCHREPEYDAIFRRVRAKLFQVAGVGEDWQLGLLAGSGTAAMEAMTLGAVRAGRKLLVCRNGIYGERLATIAARHGIEVVSVRGPQTEPIDPSAVAGALDADREIDAVAVVHHETTTGLLNPVHEIAAEARSRGVPVAVDAISSLGAEDLRLDGTGIDFVACTSNKCLHGLPGAAFVLMSPQGAARVREAPARSLYFDLGAYLDAQAKGSVPYTPSVPAVYGLEAALDELLDEGVEARRAAYRARVRYLDAQFERLGLTPIVALPNRSSSVRSLPLPRGLSYEDLHDAVKRDGYVIYGGLGDAARTSFRVCTLGAVEIGALEGFIDSLERAIEAAGAASPSDLQRSASTAIPA